MPYCFNDIFVRQRDRQTKVFARCFSLSGKIKSVRSWRLIRFEKGVPLSWRKPFFTIKRASLRYKETPPLSANNSVHSPLHSERGRGRGCSWVGGEAVDGLWWGFFSPLISRMHLLSLPTEFSEVNAYDLHTMETLVSVFIANLLEISR